MGGWEGVGEGGRVEELRVGGKEGGRVGVRLGGGREGGREGFIVVIIGQFTFKLIK